MVQACMLVLGSGVIRTGGLSNQPAPATAAARPGHPVLMRTPSGGREGDRTFCLPAVVP